MANKQRIRERLDDFAAIFSISTEREREREREMAERGFEETWECGIMGMVGRVGALNRVSENMNDDGLMGVFENGKSETGFLKNL